MAPKENEKSSFAQMKLRLAIQKRKKEKKEKQSATETNGTSNKEQSHQPSSSKLAKERVAQLKAKKKHLSAKDYAEARALAASISQKSSHEQAAWLSQHLQTWMEKSPQNDAEDIDDTFSTDTLLSLPQKKGRLEDSILTINSHIADASGLKNGQPKMIIVSPAAMNIVNVHKQCPKLKIQKLFAKHMKLHEQIESLKTTKLAVGGCTPNRLQKLIESGALSLDKLQYILLDVSLDAKQRTMFDIPEVSNDFWVLWKQFLDEKVKNDGAKVALFA